METREIFKLDKMLGVGSFGTTYRAFVLDEKRKKKWGDLVVIKIPHNKEKEMTLIEELNLNHRLSDLKAENLVRYLGFERFDDKYVMVMEYIDGESLRDKIGGIGHQRQLPLNETLNIAKQICRGLIEIHSCHIFHRDIKPDNIMITNRDNVVKISDFGISTVIKSSELASTTSGTIVYMPKEILKGKGGAFYSDIYSLGVTIYEMLTGQLPFEGENYDELISNICDKEPVYPMQINCDVDEKLNSIILKSLSKEFKNRYQSAQEFLQVIERYEKGSDFEIEEAWELFKQGRYSEAEKKFNTVLRSDPDNGKIYLNIGEFYNKCQRNKEAILIYRKGIVKCEKNSLLYRDLSLSLNRDGKNAEAIEYLSKAISIGLDDRVSQIAMILLDKWKHINKI
jgi:serine/threonine protein kinase